MKKIRIPIFIIIFICLFYIWSEIITINKDMSTQTSKNIQVDYFLLGSSHVYLGVNPLEIWKQTGFTGYNLGSDLQTLDMSYLILKEEIENGTKPSVVFLDCFAFDYEAGNSSYSLETASRYSLNINKIEYINTLSKDEMLKNVFPFLTFHSRIYNLAKNDYNLEKNNKPFSFLGYMPYFINYENEEEDFYKEGESVAISEKTLDSFNKIYEFCNENNIELILIKTPASEWTKKHHDYVEQSICSEYELDFLDFNEIYKEIGIDLKTDFADPYHTNTYGAIKTSKYLGSYIEENFEWESQKDNETMELFNQKYEEYLRYSKISINDKIEDVNEYMESFLAEDYIIIVVSQNDKNSKVEVYDDGKKIKEASGFTSSLFIEIDGVDIYCESSMDTQKIPSKIQVEYQNYADLESKNFIVVYDKFFNRVVSSRAF